MTSRVEHTDVGAYALGLLEEDDRQAYEAHLLGCSACRSELAELAGVASVLHGIGPVEDAEPPPFDPQDDVIDLLRRKKAADRRTRRGTFVIGMAAAVTLVAGGLTIGTQLGADDSAQVAQGHPGHMGTHMGPAEQFYAEGKPIAGTGAGGVTGGLVVESKGWGTHAALKLAGVKGPLECELISVAKSGERRVMTGWSVPPAGYGVPGSPDPLYMHGGSATPLKDVDRFEVVTATGERLLTIKA
ncbi:zf-HC2 domain-containing protein [Nonomuraea sp. K274]|uniref:Zf-HC2 domain-containing protein n=1 Tax=Nonomuraea cypriaca TaxID=1187855 RepID=A0A931F1T3_9ACTN|nr:zf-HC2 domain-containing protein [Nonomuraea cypriaca]MBF8189937.1 zf-HC2 domain-containing protein [Nonomuraea cypriaca]